MCPRNFQKSCMGFARILGLVPSSRRKRSQSKVILAIKLGLSLQPMDGMQTHSFYKCNAPLSSPGTSSVSRDWQETANLKNAGPNHEFTLLNVNARSVVKKVFDLESLILTYSSHVIVMRETWSNTDTEDDEMLSFCFRMLRKDREM